MSPRELPVTAMCLSLPGAGLPKPKSHSLLGAMEEATLLPDLQVL